MGALKDLLEGGDGSLATVSTNELANELIRRKTNGLVYPAHVFNVKLKQYINLMCSAEAYDLPVEFVCTSLLSAYGSAIGNAYWASANNDDKVCLVTWACLLGISSSGKSFCINKVFEPILKIQGEMDRDWKESTKDSTTMDIANMRLRTLLYRDAHVPTMVRTILPDNPKGVIKYSDELLEWINGMDSLSKKEGTDTQFWLSGFNGSSYRALRSGKQTYYLPNVWVSVIGGTQYKVVPRFFEKDRDTSGFIYRMLFALPSVDKVPIISSTFSMPTEFKDMHERAIRTLFNLKVEYEDFELPDPRVCALSLEARKVYDKWRVQNIHKINARVGDDMNTADDHAAIFGKIPEYALRFAAILHLMDRCMDDGKPYENALVGIGFNDVEVITSGTMARAIELADYYYESMKRVYELVKITTYAPKDVLVLSVMMKAGKRESEIGRLLWPNLSAESARRKTNRFIKESILKYPRVFGAYAR